MSIKKLITACFAFLPLLLVAQSSKPNWINADSRRLIYSENEYFIGFASGFAKQGETLDAATARMKAEAQGDAAQRIQVHVHSEAFDAVQSVQQRTAETFDEEVHRIYHQQTSTSSSIDIPNLQVMTWNDTATHEVAVLVYTKRRDFVRYYDRQIESLLGKMESAIADIAIQEKQGQKSKAVKTAETALESCPSVEYSQRMVALADPEVSNEDLQMSRYMTAMHDLAETITRLKYATTYYINCRASIGETDYPMLDKEVRGLLANNGCNFIDTRNDADWIIEINASVVNTMHRDGMPYYIYVDGTISIENSVGKRIMEDRISALEAGHPDGIKGGEFNADKAVRIAYRETARIISETILKFVQE